MQESPQHVVGRVAALLRALSGREPSGDTTSGLARESGLARATVHRLLTSLAEEGLVDRDQETGRWLLGPETFLLGSAAAGRYDVATVALPYVRRLAVATEESAFLSSRRGDETVCLLREDGSFPIRSHVLHEGIRFPLGVASAGLAVLAHLPDREVASYLDRADLAPRFGASHARGPLLERVAATRRTGWAVNPGLIVEGSWGMGAAVFDGTGRPQWALSLTGIESRFSPARQPELGRLLLQAAHALSKALTGRRSTTGLRPGQ